MATAGAEDLLSEAQFLALQEEKEQLIKEQKLLNMDIRAMKLEMTKRSGEPAPVEARALAAEQRLAQLSAELTGLQLEEVSFHLVSAEEGVTVTRWRVRAVSEDANAEILLHYDTTKDEHSNVTCSDLEVEEFTPSLAPLMDVAGESPRDALFGLYQLGRLVAERREVSGGG
ncbi:uncharacterized protein LOC122374330, partial [Amphibalanus amphitrite]|uniref:uncharacterized protein LOC122374330 n=1 Tax=Amphibalanus amphitrite TaxID=1232801 RepID=UPI001C8FBDAF